MNNDPKVVFPELDQAFIQIVLLSEALEKIKDIEAIKDAYRALIGEPSSNLGLGVEEELVVFFDASLRYVLLSLEEKQRNDIICFLGLLSGEYIELFLEHLDSDLKVFQSLENEEHSFQEAQQQHMIASTEILRSILRFLEDNNFGIKLLSTEEIATLFRESL